MTFWGRYKVSVAETRAQAKQVNTIPVAISVTLVSLLEICISKIQNWKWN